MTRWRKAYLAAAIVIGLGVALVAAVGWYASDKVIHPKQDPSPYRPEDYANLPLEDVHFQSRDGLKLVGWFVPGKSSATIVLAHGRDGYKDWGLPDADYLYRAGFSVLLFDFRYRGESEGDAQTLGAKESWDIQSAVDYLMTRRDVDPVPEFDGRWVASFAPVAGSEFVVLVQQRYEPVVPRELWLLLMLLLAAIVLTLAIKFLLPRSPKPVPA